MRLFTPVSQVFGVVVLVGLAAIAQSKAPSAVGHWKLNVEKSDFGSNPKPKSGTVDITADSAAMLKWSGTMTDANGKRETYRYSGPEDGQPHPVTGNNSWKSAAYTRDDSGVNKEIVTLKDGGTLTNDLSTSADGNTITVKGSNGATEVWERMSRSAGKSSNGSTAKTKSGSAGKANSSAPPE